MPAAMKEPRFNTAREMVAGYAEKLNAKEQNVLAAWAAGCAEHVLRRFTERHPHDDRPRRAIEAARAWASGEIRCGLARGAAVEAHAAARECGHPAATAAARATGHAAGTAHMRAHGSSAAAYAILAVMFDDPDAALTERDWQIQHLESPP